MNEARRYRPSWEWFGSGSLRVRALLVDQMTLTHIKPQEVVLASDYDAICAERDRLQEALDEISAEGRHARSGGTAYRMAVIARTALKEDEDE